MGKFKSKVMLVSGFRSDSNPGFSREFLLVALCLLAGLQYNHFDCISVIVPLLVAALRVIMDTTFHPNDHFV